VHSIRVLLIDMAPMTREIVRDTISSAPDIALVGEFPADTSVAQVAADSEADVVIFGRAGEGLRGRCQELMSNRPRTRVLILERDGRLYELRPRAVPLGEASPSTLLDAVRSG
jgi:DNA-binding NarL/FixJ family response regulator